MLSLRELQAGFAAALFNPGAEQGSARHSRRRHQSRGAGSASIAPTYSRTTARRCARPIRRSRSWSAPGFFASLAEEYTRRYPSRSGDVGRHGRAVCGVPAPSSCARRAALSRRCRAPGVVHRGELQRSRAMRRCSLQRLAAVPPEQCEQLRFLLAPSCRLMSSLFPVDRIWQICQPGYRGRRAASIWTQGGVEPAGPPPGFHVMVEPSDWRVCDADRAGYGHDFAEAFDCALLDDGFDPAAFLQKLRVRSAGGFTLPAERAGRLDPRTL